MSVSASAFSYLRSKTSNFLSQLRDQGVLLRVGEPSVPWRFASRPSDTCRFGFLGRALGVVARLTQDLQIRHRRQPALEHRNDVIEAPRFSLFEREHRCALFAFLTGSIKQDQPRASRTNGARAVVASGILPDAGQATTEDVVLVQQRAMTRAQRIRHLTPPGLSEGRLIQDDASIFQSTACQHLFSAVKPRASRHLSTVHVGAGDGTKEPPRDRLTLRLCNDLPACLAGLRDSFRGIVADLRAVLPSGRWFVANNSMAVTAGCVVHA